MSNLLSFILNMFFQEEEVELPEEDFRPIRAVDRYLARNFQVVGANFATFQPGDRISMEHVLAWLENDEDIGGELTATPIKEQG